MLNRKMMKSTRQLLRIQRNPVQDDSSLSDSDFSIRQSAVSIRIDHGLLAGHVLQRQRGGGRATIRGMCPTSGPVTACVRGANGRVCAGSKRTVGRARHGRFQAQLTNIPVGGPWRITLRCGAASVEVPDVFVGDVWLMAGQSNMEGCASRAGAAAPHPLIRCFTMARRWEQAREPLHLKIESPDPVHGGQALSAAASAQARKQAQKGRGVGLHFARLMLERTGVPQGLIATAHGGTSMQQWSPAGRNRGGESLYGSMLLSLRAVGQPLAGVLWYQGESEALPLLTPTYARDMRRLVAAVRRDLGQPALPWLMVQIGRFIIGGYNNANGWPDPTSWNRIQDLQRLLPRTIAHCAVVPAVDLELEDLAHVASDGFAILAKRLAEIASRLVHHDTRTQPPITVHHRGQCTVDHRRDERAAEGPRRRRRPGADATGTASRAAPHRRRKRRLPRGAGRLRRETHTGVSRGLTGDANVNDTGAFACS